MILRRYGATFHSVETNFDSKALSEVGFRRDRETEIPGDEFETRYEKVAEHELGPEAEGHVHDEVEQAALNDLQSSVEALLADLPEGGVLVVESEQGVDYPKTRAVQKNVVIQGENRLHFTVRVDPPLRIGVYRLRP